MCEWLEIGLLLGPIWGVMLTIVRRSHVRGSHVRGREGGSHVRGREIHVTTEIENGTHVIGMTETGMIERGMTLEIETDMTIDHVTENDTTHVTGTDTTTGHVITTPVTETAETTGTDMIESESMIPEIGRDMTHVTNVPDPDLLSVIRHVIQPLHVTRGLTPHLLLAK